MKFEAYIGLEVHIQLLTKTKAFCSCRAAFGAEPNTNVCPSCLGYPGTLPVLNKEGLRMAYLVARAFNLKLATRTWFERKQYFYPDMSKNYQISQMDAPVGVGGWVEFALPLGGLLGESSGEEPYVKRIRIKECHFEEDAGKMIHAGNLSLVDYNRAGMPLLEIVSEPDFKNGTEAELYLQQLRKTLRYLAVCDGNMEEGSMRCDANVSVNLAGAGLGTKVEIKNLNSSRFVRLGLDHEIARQTAILEKGGSVKAETRLWNENRDQTESMREKGAANDYRFFPEPDIPPFEPDAVFLAELEASMVELPYDREKRLSAKYGLSRGQASSICEEKLFADFFEESVSAQNRLGIAKSTAGERGFVWMSGEIRRLLNQKGLGAESVYSLGLRPEQLASIIAMTLEGRASSKAARLVFDACLAGEGEPEAILKERGWGIITDPAAISHAVEEAFKSEALALADVLGAMLRGDAAKTKALNAYLVGKAIAASGGRADPKLIRAEVQKCIEERSGK
ncbi:Asp-tRNA(Asn)/Glu-tRNA(Gln) amidotransferase subunit GatB [Spirochaetota bacterium]